MVKKKGCPPGYVERKGAERRAYRRKTSKRVGYWKCPPGAGSDCPQEEKIWIEPKGEVAGAIVPAGEIPPTCVPDIGKPGKTPEEEKWAVKELRGGLSQYFDIPPGKKVTEMFPNAANNFDLEPCVRAGITARTFETEKGGGASYQELSGRFLQQAGLRANQPERADTQKVWEQCRQGFLTGFDPEHPPAVSKSHPEFNIEHAKALKIAKRVEPEVLRNLSK